MYYTLESLKDRLRIHWHYVEKGESKHSYCDICYDPEKLEYINISFNMFPGFCDITFLGFVGNVHRFGFFPMFVPTYIPDMFGIHQFGILNDNSAYITGTQGILRIHLVTDEVQELVPLFTKL